MGTEWIETTVGDFCPFHYGKGLPERNRIPGPYPVFGSNGQVGSHYQPFVNEPGIIIGRKGTVGAVHFSKLPFCPIDTTFYVVSADYRDLRFTYYLLKSLGLDRMNADSAVPGLNREAAHKRKILVPPLSTQRAIAHILGTPKNSPSVPPTTAKTRTPSVCPSTSSAFSPTVFRNRSWARFRRGGRWFVSIK